MKLFLLAAALAGAVAANNSDDPHTTLLVDESDYEHARVVPGVLSDDSVAKLHQHVGTLRLLRTTGSDGTNRKYGAAAVQPDDLRRIVASIGDHREVREATTLHATLITGDTEPHIDVKVGGSSEFDEDEEETMFVFLNDNEGAYFQIGEDKVPAKAGTLVSFQGNSKVHNTVVPSGTEVRLLGPIASRDLKDVNSSSGFLSSGLGGGTPCTAYDGDDPEECASFDTPGGCSGSCEIIRGRCIPNCGQQYVQVTLEFLCSCNPEEHEAWENHGAYVSCVVEVAKALDLPKKGKVISEAAKSDCGKSEDV